MRQLTEEETETVLEKLVKFLGENTTQLLNPSENVSFVLRLHEKKVFYINQRLIPMMERVARERLASAGTVLGKFTHHGRFHLAVTALDVLSRFCVHKIWLKQSNEMAFLYGNHIPKASIRKITHGCPRNQGVVILSQKDLPLGFGVTARSVVEMRLAKPTDVMVYNQADTGFYLRNERTSAIFG